MKKGFTLIEILIVISIILVLVGIGLESFARSRQNLLLTIETDKLMTVLHDLRDAAKVAPRCYSIVLTPQKAEKIVAGFKNKIAGCSTENQKSLLSFPPELRISINLDDKPHDSITINFLPPFGSLSINPAGKKVELRISLQNNNERFYSILLHPDTGKIEKK